MLPLTLPRTLYRPADEQLRMTDKNVEYVISHVTAANQHFSSTLWEKMREAINNEEIVGRLFDNPQGSVYKRIQKWLWNTYSFNITQKSGEKMDCLEKAIQQCREDSLTFPIEVELGRLMDWNDGDFGDSGSCYFGSNAVTRRYLNSQDNFRTLRVWKDGRGFGRALILSDVGGEGMSLIYNTYPGHSEAKFQQLFASALAHTLTVHHQVEHKHKEVTIENRSDGSWFYTNAKKGALLYPQSAQKEADNTTQLVISFGKRPEVRRIDGYVCDCIVCGRPKEDGTNRGEAIFEYDRYIKVPGTRVGAGICQKCSSTKEKCQKCNKEVIALSVHGFNLANIKGVGTTAEKRGKSGEKCESTFVCDSCFNTKEYRLV